jgi:hypothetical protein
MKKEPTVDLNKEMNRSCYQVLYPVCPAGGNRSWIRPCVPLHIPHGTSPRTYVCTALISRLAHHQRTFSCNMYKWHSLSDYHFLQLHRFGHLLIYNPFSLFSKPLFFLFPVSCLPGWNNFRVFKESSNFLLYGEHVSISAEIHGRPRSDLLFLKIGKGDISSGNIKSVDVFSVDLWSGRSRIWGCFGSRTTCDFRTESTKWDCLCCRFLSWQQCSCTGVVLICCSIEIKVFKNICLMGAGQ